MVLIILKCYTFRFKAWFLQCSPAGSISVSVFHGPSPPPANSYSGPGVPQGLHPSSSSFGTATFVLWEKAFEGPFQGQKSSVQPAEMLFSCWAFEPFTWMELEFNNPLPYVGVILLLDGGCPSLGAPWYLSPSESLSASSWGGPEKGDHLRVSSGAGLQARMGCPGWEFSCWPDSWDFPHFQQVVRYKGALPSVGRCDNPLGQDGMAIAFIPPPHSYQTAAWLFFPSCLCS